MPSSVCGNRTQFLEAPFYPTWIPLTFLRQSIVHSCMTSYRPAPYSPGSLINQAMFVVDLGVAVNQQKAAEKQKRLQFAMQFKSLRFAGSQSVKVTIMASRSI